MLGEREAFAMWTRERDLPPGLPASRARGHRGEQGERPTNSKTADENGDENG